MINLNPLSRPVREEPVKQESRQERIDKLKQYYKKFDIEIRDKKEKDQDLHKLRVQRNFWVVILVVLIISAAGLVMVNQDKFKSLTAVNMTCPEIPACPSSPSCPACNCNCQNNNTCSVPKDLRITFINNTS